MMVRQRQAPVSSAGDGAWLLGLSLLVGVAATLWIVAAVRRLARYADEAEAE